MLDDPPNMVFTLEPSAHPHYLAARLHGRPALKAFAEAKLHEPFIERIFVDNTRLVDADMVGIGFYRESTMLHVKKGALSYAGYRLNLIVPKRWAMLQSALDHDETLPPK